MQGDGIDVIPEFANITPEDKQWLARLGITASKKKKAAVPLISPQRATPASEPPESQLETGEALAMQEQEQSGSGSGQKERHTVLPELPNALFHMAGGEDFEATDDEDLKDEYRGLASVPDFLQKAWNESTKNAVSRGYMAGALDALRWAKRITVQGYSEGYDVYVYGNGDPIQKEARGGWHRVSQYTIESDDKRFTITLIDPTRRSKWFMLKDTESGKSYEDRTMTDAKKRAIRIRESKADEFHHDDGSDRYSLAGEPEQVSSPYSNELLKKTTALNSPTCSELFNCCDCGGNDCGCAYCFSCHACDHCLNDDGQPCEYSGEYNR
jgi:hypothetical protein